ncbi:MAG: hypothetical protein GF329_04605 [Candidatus Lokiarchaeota archaeon]|nr:hypothetical protein [Candidatus Lokiarchaeota archaeon]
MRFGTINMNINIGFDSKSFSEKFIKYAVTFLLGFFISLVILISFTPISIFLKLFIAIIIITAISLGLSALYALNKPPDTRDEYAFDPWSIPHFLVPLDFSL